jgi:hypothetical protein
MITSLTAPIVELRELTTRVDGCYERRTKGKQLFGDSSRREEYYRARGEIAIFEQELLGNRHTSQNILTAQLNAYLAGLDNLREQLRERYEPSIGGKSR